MDPVNLTVRVKPGSRKGPLVEGQPAQGAPVEGPCGELTVFLRERAVDGRANAALIAVLAEHFGVARSRAEIVHGHASRIKQVRIDL
ncbi:MAG: DUF167 domain-containing protein [Lacisediminihabitans sp.]